MKIAAIIAAAAASGLAAYAVRLRRDNARLKEAYRQALDENLELTMYLEEEREEAMMLIDDMPFILNRIAKYCVN
jgi:hypothetical protein